MTSGEPVRLGVLYIQHMNCVSAGHCHSILAHAALMSILGRTRKDETDRFAGHPAAEARDIGSVSESHVVVPGQQRPLLQPCECTAGCLALHAVQHHQLNSAHEPQPIVLADRLWWHSVLYCDTALTRHIIHPDIAPTVCHSNF